MENGEVKIDENLATKQKTIEAAAGEVAHYTKAEREKFIQQTPDNVRIPEGAAARCTKVIKEERSRNSQKSQSGTLGEMLLGTRKASQNCM